MKIPSEYESLGYAYDLLYDIKTQEQLTNEIDYLVERLSGIAKLCRQDGYSIDDYILMMLHFPKDEAMKGEYEMLDDCRKQFDDWWAEFTSALGE